MVMQESIPDLEKLIRTNYYVDSEMAAYLDFICSKDRKAQGQLFGHLIQFRGIMEPNGDLKDNTFIGNDEWRNAVIDMEAKWKEIRDNVLEAEVPLAPEQVGEIIAEAVGSEQKEIKKMALLSWVLQYGKPGFVPYVTVPELANKARNVGLFELYELSNAVKETIQRVKAICISPLFKTPLMKAAALQVVLDEIEDPMQRAVVLATYVHVFVPKTETPIGIAGTVDDLDKVLSEALSEFHGCSGCDERGTCNLPHAKIWRAENT